MPNDTVLYCECPDHDWKEKIPMAILKSNGTLAIKKRGHGKSHILYIVSHTIETEKPKSN